MTDICFTPDEILLTFYLKEKVEQPNLLCFESTRSQVSPNNNKELIIPKYDTMISTSIMTHIPIALYAFQSCSHYLDFPSLTNDNVIFGTLLPSNTSDFFCNVNDGVRVHTDLKVDTFNAKYVSILSNTAEEVELPNFESKKTIVSLQRTFSRDPPNGITFSTWLSLGPSTPTKSPTRSWFSPTATENTEDDKTATENSIPIITIGDPNTRHDDKEQQDPFSDDDYMTLGDDYLHAGCDGYDFQISQYQKHFLISYTDNDPSRSCRFLVVRDFNVSHSAIMHIAVGFDAIGQTTNVMINGNAVVYGAPNEISTDALLSQWNSNSTLRLFSSMANTKNYFKGAIHQFAIYDEYLNDEQVNLIIDEGIIDIQSDDDIYEPVNDTRVSDQVILLKPTNRTTIRQDANESASIELASYNSTTLLLRLAVEILKTPKYGLVTTTASVVIPYENASNLTQELLLPGNLTRSEVSTISGRTLLAIPFGGNSIVINYTLGSHEYFNIPPLNSLGIPVFLSDEDTAKNEEVIQYRIVSLDPKNESNIISASAIINHKVNVLHVNHPSNLTVPQDAVLDALDPTNGVVVGINLEDEADYNIDFVRVDVFTSSSAGYLTLNPMYLAMADFESCRYRLGWRCTGDGIHERSMTFVAKPADVPYILRNLQYKSVSNDLVQQNDTITIRIYDGAGDMCLQEDEQSYYYTSEKGETIAFQTVFDGCFVQEATINVPGYDLNAKPVTDSRSGVEGMFATIKSVLVENILFCCAILFVLTWILCCCRSCYRCLVRGTKVIPDNFVEGTDVEKQPY